MKRMRHLYGNRFSRSFMLTIMVIAAVAWFLPLLYVVCASLMDAEELRYVFGGNIRIRLAPVHPTLQGYFEALIATPKYIARYWNSLLIAGSVTAIQAVFSLIAGFAFKMGRFKGKGVLRYLYIAIMLMPFQVTLLPNYILISDLNLYNTFWALILPGAFAPFGTFLMMQFLKTMPEEIIEASLLETNSVPRILTQIVVPCVYPGWIATMVITFAEYWNLVEQPSILLKDEWMQPLSLALGSQNMSNLPLLFAGSVLYMLPMILIYHIFEDELLEGLEKARF